MPRFKLRLRLLSWLKRLSKFDIRQKVYIPDYGGEHFALFSGRSLKGD